jgi:dihydrofolate synthase/folylpolyglutamate synthase
LNYEEATAFLEERIRWGMRPGTERVAAVVEVLGDPQHSYPVIHVSGTNGKFSVATMITAILSRLGLTVGTYTSPHLESVRERIAIGETPIDEATFASVLSYLRPFVEQVEAQRDDVTTYFELLTVMAFEAFFDAPVHVGVLEAGLGGEYDATNVADANVGVVVGVSLDHVRQFGDDLRKAAWEKAGIAKAETTVVTGVGEDDLFAIVEARAAERGARNVVRLGRDVEVVERRPAHGGQTVSVRAVYGEYDDIFLSQYGAHQATNAALAIAACEAFVGEALNVQAVEEAFAAVRTPGRIDVVGRRPLIVLDGGHNPAAAVAVRTAVEESFSYDRLIVVAGMLDDKLIEDVIGVWAPLATQWIVTAPQVERAAPSERIVDALVSEGIAADAIDVADTVGEGLAAALEGAAPEDLVLVFGSFRTVGEAMTWLRASGRVPHA